MSITQPVKWVGGKHYLAKRIVSLMARHLHYCEPYAGGASVLLERDPNDESLWLPPHQGVSELLNDLNRDLMVFWGVLRNPDWFGEFSRACQMTPLSHDTFDLAHLAETEKWESHIGRAWAFFVRARQSRAGSFKGFTSLTRSRLRRGINGNASEWLGAVEGLPAVHARLQPVVLENMDAVKLIKREDTTHTLFYCDCPYLHETRSGDDYYAHEMTEAQHLELLETLAGIQGKFMLSGYNSALYAKFAAKYSWRVHTFDLANHASGQKEKRRMTEYLYLNYDK